MPKLLTMSPEAHKAMAIRWMLKGFTASGAGFHGEIYDREKYPALEGLLLSHFDTVYCAERDAAEDARNKARASRSAPRGRKAKR